MNGWKIGADFAAAALSEVARRKIAMSAGMTMLLLLIKEGGRGSSWFAFVRMWLCPIFWPHSLEINILDFIPSRPLLSVVDDVRASGIEYHTCSGRLRKRYRNEKVLFAPGCSW